MEMSHLLMESWMVCGGTGTQRIHALVAVHMRARLTSTRPLTGRSSHHLVHESCKLSGTMALPLVYQLVPSGRRRASGDNHWLHAFSFTSLNELTHSEERAESEAAQRVVQRWPQNGRMAHPCLDCA